MRCKALRKLPIFVCIATGILMATGGASAFSPPDREPSSARSNPTSSESLQSKVLSDAELDQITAGAHGDPHFFDIFIPLDPNASIPVGGGDHAASISRRRAKSLGAWQPCVG